MTRTAGLLLALCVGAAGCSLFMTPKERVKAKMRKRGEVVAEWTDKHGYDHLMRRDNGRLNHYYIRTYPYTEPELIGYVDPKTGRCISLNRSIRRNESQKAMLARVQKAQEEAYQRLVAEAAQRGANAVFIKRGSGGYGAQALYFSSAEPVYPSAAALLSRAKKPAGFSVSHKTIRTLETFAPLEIAARKRRCYALTFVLDRDARLARHTRDGLTLDLQSVDRELDITMFGARVFGKGRSHVVTLGCPDRSGPLVVHLGSGPSKERKPGMGQGKLVIQVHSKKISARELADIVNRRKENWAKTRRQNCSDCYYLRVRCGADDPRDCPRYLRCLRKRGETINSCRAMQ